MDTTKKVGRKHSLIRELYYITHIDNVPSMMKKGILSHEQMIAKNIKYTPIYDKGIISRRHGICVPDGRSLWDFANLYFNVRNPMLFRVGCEKSLNDIAVLGIKKTIMKLPDIFVTTGNAAHSQSQILRPDPQVISEIAKQIDKEWWSEIDGSKRKIMAECLVPGEVPPEYIDAVYVASYDSRDKITKKLGLPYALSTIYEPNMFFQPVRHFNLTPRLSVVDGDMFFSRMQTLTVSVNCVGVMGKGIASRARYQFPGVFVHYQDACRKRKLRMGKPHLYKRGYSSDYDLVDEPQTLTNSNLGTWFLLFATKTHWRYRSDINGIEKGLQWLSEHYKTEGITSLAIPALGCGLGRLNWVDVGPLMCKYLSTLEIPVMIYLPTEKQISEKLLSKDFLLPE